MIEIDKEKIILERANQCLSRSDLSLKSGVSRVTIIKIENGKVNPRLVTVGKIAKALGKKIEDFRKN